MASPSKPPSTSTSQPAKGTNPAPNFSTTMNRIQLLLDARSRLVSSSLLGQTKTKTTKPLPSTPGAFSSLATDGRDLSSGVNEGARTRQKRVEEEEAAFAEERALDPNAGIGIGTLRTKDARGGLPSSSSSAARERERENRALKGKLQLLGKRKGGGGGARGAAEKYRDANASHVDDDDEEEEPGRSALGREGSRRWKRRRVQVQVREEDGEDEDEENGKAGGVRLGEEVLLSMRRDKEVIDTPDAGVDNAQPEESNAGKDQEVGEANHAGADADDGKDKSPKGETEVSNQAQCAESTAAAPSRKRKRKRKKTKPQSTSAE